jgi:hypothetical protein
MRNVRTCSLTFSEKRKLWCYCGITVWCHYQLFQTWRWVFKLNYLRKSKVLIDVLDTTLLYFTLLYFAYSAYLLLLLLCLRSPLIYSLLSILFYSIYSILFYSILFNFTLYSFLHEVGAHGTVSSNRRWLGVAQFYCCYTRLRSETTVDETRTLRPWVVLVFIREPYQHKYISVVLTYDIWLFYIVSFDTVLSAPFFYMVLR